MELLAAGIILGLLFVATYSQRRTWIALGSALLSVALVSGFLFLSTAQDTTPFRDGLTQLAKMLPARWDRRVQNLAASIERASLGLADARKRGAEHRQPLLATSDAKLSDWFDGDSWSWKFRSWKSWTWESWSWGSQAETKSEPKPRAEAEQTIRAEPTAKAEPKARPAADAGGSRRPANSSGPIKLLLDEPPPVARENFGISGANISDQPLTTIRAVLKPDSGAPHLELSLQVDGLSSANGGVIPPGARFTLTAPDFTPDAATHGGAILSLAYSQAGRQKTSITYLTPQMLTARATGG